jgi:hypothetical protein
MSWNLEYYYLVGRPNWILLAPLALLIFAVSTAAQINAAPPSVTSVGFGGRAFSPLFPSVTSLGPRGYTPGFNPAFPNSRPLFGLHPPPPFVDGHHHHHPDNGSVPLVGVYGLPYYAYYDPGYMPYYPYYQANDAQNDTSDDPYDGGPTVFDRRGRGTPARPPAANSEDQATRSAPPPPPEASETDPPVIQPATVLVFKDGRRMEIENYAIVGNTLYDLSDGARRKVPLADLDIGATTKQNDERGIDFQIPSGT